MKPSFSPSIQTSCCSLVAIFLIAILALSAPAFAATPSPSGTIATPGNGSITDASGNVFTLTSSGVSQENSKALAGGSGPGEIEYYNSVVYFQDASSHTWYTWNGSNFVASAGPSPTPPPPPPQPAVDSLNIFTPSPSSEVPGRYNANSIHANIGVPVSGPAGPGQPGCACVNSFSSVLTVEPGYDGIEAYGGAFGVSTTRELPDF